MLSSPTDFDELNYRRDSSITKMLSKDEQIYLSAVVYKFNKSLKRQERSILITNKAIYNVNKQDLLANFISVFSSNFKVRRRIDMCKLSGITVSDLSSEFVIHIADEYDYRYASPDKRDKILSVICRAFYQQVKGRSLFFFFKSEVNLIKYTTTTDDKKAHKNRMPTDNPLPLDEESLQVKLNELAQKRQQLKENTVTVFTKTSNSQKVTLDDFDMLKVLGRGAFGKVMLVEKKDTKKVYAMKSLHKEEIIDKEQIEHTKTERFVLEKSKSPFLVGLEFAFQTPEKIFFVMNFMRGGELFQHLRNSRRFDERRAKFYAAEVLLGLEYLHALNVIYRDLKPENILMDEEGHVCLTDFGMAKQLKEGQKTKSFVGTPEYLAPEIIDGDGHGKPVDWWALGILIYEMLFGVPPFYNKEQNTQEMFTAITKRDITFGHKVVLSTEGKDLIQKLLTKNAKDRLGTKGADEIKAHKWFHDIDWDKLKEKQMPTPFKPKISSEVDVDNFDEEFTSEKAYNSVIPNANMNLVGKYQNEFADFSYMPKNGLLDHN